MQHSSVIQYFYEKFQRELAIEALLDVLEVRFPFNDVKMLKPALENIEDLPRLKQLHIEAFRVLNLDEFKRILAS